MPLIRYRPVRPARLFNAVRRYDQINWHSFPDVLHEFNRQLRGWYIAPARTLMARSGHYSFAALATTCTLIDTLSQYYYGRDQGTQKLFLKFCRTQFPELRRTFRPKIPRVWQGRNKPVRDVAGALYAGIRCGVVHEAHPSLYCAISGTGQIATIHRTGLTEFSRNGRHFYPCPTVVFDPGPLLTAVTRWLRAYLAQLQAPGAANAKRRRLFAKKFYASFGIRI